MKTAIGYLFGHYDSRGGATLMVGDKDVQAAVKRYVEESFLTLPTDSWYQDQIDWLGEELMAVVSVKYDPEWLGCDVVYGPNEGDPRIAHALVWHETDITEEGMVEDASWIVEIVVSTTPPEPPPGFKYASMDFFGEDAFGLIVR